MRNLIISCQSTSVVEYHRAAITRFHKTVLITNQKILTSECQNFSAGMPSGCLTWGLLMLWRCKCSHLPSNYLMKTSNQRFHRHQRMYHTHLIKLLKCWKMLQFSNQTPGNVRRMFTSILFLPVWTSALAVLLPRGTAMTTSVPLLQLFPRPQVKVSTCVSTWTTSQHWLLNKTLQQLLTLSSLLPERKESLQHDWLRDDRHLKHKLWSSLLPKRKGNFHHGYLRGEHHPKHKLLYSLQQTLDHSEILLHAQAKWWSRSTSLVQTCRVIVRSKTATMNVLWLYFLLFCCLFVNKINRNLSL